MYWQNKGRESKSNLDTAQNTAVQKSIAERVQVLPVNDTQVFRMWWDSYPYSAISVFALHPIYLSLPALVSGRGPRDFMEAVDAARRKHLQTDMDYEVTLDDKLRLARTVYDSPQGRQCASCIPTRHEFVLHLSHCFQA